MKIYKVKIRNRKTGKIVFTAEIGSKEITKKNKKDIEKIFLSAFLYVLKVSDEEKFEKFKEIVNNTKIQEAINKGIIDDELIKAQKIYRISFEDISEDIEKIKIKDKEKFNLKINTTDGKKMLELIIIIDKKNPFYKELKLLNDALLTHWLMFRIGRDLENGKISKDLKNSFEELLKQVNFSGKMRKKLLGLGLEAFLISLVNQDIEDIKKIMKIKKMQEITSLAKCSFNSILEKF